MIPPFNEFFPEQLYLKNSSRFRFLKNFSFSCPPPTGRVPSDTISTNQFQISRANKKQGCLYDKILIFPFHAAHPPLGTCGQVILCQQTSFKFPAQIKKNKDARQIWYLVLTSFSRCLLEKEFKRNFSEWNILVQKSKGFKEKC